jgi:hypothetical protein
MQHQLGIRRPQKPAFLIGQSDFFYVPTVLFGQERSSGREEMGFGA